MSESAIITVDEIDRQLPQTQCGKCGHPGCRPYAEAIAAGEAINRCPPGGESTVRALAELLDRPEIPLEQSAEQPKLAVIREDECIGCVKCLRACPVDAIVGAAKRMHTVIEQECTGCELCVEPCPVDCIDIVPHPGWERAADAQEQQAWLARRAELGRQRFHARNERLEHRRAERETRRRERLKRRLGTRDAAPEPAESREARPVTTGSSGRPLRDQRSSRAARAAARTAVRRLEQRLEQTRARNEDATQDEAELERARQRLADIDAQRDTAPEHDRPPEAEAAPDTDSATLNRLRMAVAAADQARQRARRQLSHAERRGSDADREEARATLDDAEAMHQRAVASLEQALPSGS
ncbi:electron transport complex protein RnfB [Kushneria sinocarnis]|uniref:Ion-translocating oxidoreductase complex subunit B n=1 Tax=Kushneria sinocarnis TaxID=595502 RepID=A0A420WV09_9GAMM|nr:RnfABCDGE type electron transport complex subunit B [Kushneria sinocarnis]RKR02397.1 electron transport complex protein RnfB [Kushneria sinocarnis]